MFIDPRMLVVHFYRSMVSDYVDTRYSPRIEPLCQSLRYSVIVVLNNVSMVVERCP